MPKYTLSPNATSNIANINTYTIEKLTQPAHRIPPHVVSTLLTSGLENDYSDITQLASDQVPFLNVVRKDRTEKAKKWIEANQPNSQLFVLGAHLILYEYPDPFNKVVLESCPVYRIMTHPQLSKAWGAAFLRN